MTNFERRRAIARMKRIEEARQQRFKNHSRFLNESDDEEKIKMLYKL